MRRKKIVDTTIREDLKVKLGILNFLFKVIPIIYTSKPPFGDEN